MKKKETTNLKEAKGRFICYNCKLGFNKLRCIGVGQGYCEKCWKLEPWNKRLIND